MPRYVEMEDASAVVSQNQEHVKHLKSDGRHSEEVHRDHALDVILQERLPGLRGWIAPAYEVLAHAGFADVDAQLEQFPVDARRTPERIVEAHPTNQLPNLFGHRWTPGLPRRTFQVQNNRKPLRCQPMTVSGLTMSNEDCQSRQASHNRELVSQSEVLHLKD